MTVRFYDLSPNLAHHQNQAMIQYWQNFYHNPDICTDIKQLLQGVKNYSAYKNHWQTLNHTDDQQMTDWLMALFGSLFTSAAYDKFPTVLVRGESEPEYFASKNGEPARIEFAHGFFASALHEISHWCVAGKKRRTLDDFGYWYTADGRDQQTQKRFEQVEIKPQAIECLLNLALGRYFYVSQDNLNADFDTSDSTFAVDVFTQASHYLQNPNALPSDARRLIWLFLDIYQPF